MFTWLAIKSLLETVVGGVVSVLNKSKDVTISAYTTAVGVATAQAQYGVAVLSHPLSAPSLFCYAVTFYYSKAIAYDNIISVWITGHYGYTPPLTESTAYIAMVVVSGMFFSGIAGIIKRS